MRIVILTSIRKGTASYCIPLIKASTSAEIVQVIYSRGQIKKDLAYYRKRWRKVMRIGLLGALNGVRIRPWFEGAGLKQQLTDIEQLCRQLDLPFLETPFIGHPDTLAAMQRADAHLGISLGNPYIPKRIFMQPGMGMINIHGEVLPEFQNAQSIIWQIHEGSGFTGYTIHKIDQRIDTGDILKQERFPIPFRETLEETVRCGVDEILRRAGSGLVDVINHYPEMEKQARAQGKGRSFTTPSMVQFRRIKRQFEHLKSRSR
jgi:methionyl-tRNA formyltransferase